MMRLTSLLMLALLAQNLSAQNQFYLEYNLDMSITENYDKTYTILGDLDVLGWGSYITKVQPNGEIVWEIKLADEPDQGAFWGIKILSDSLGNTYIGGVTYFYDDDGSIFVIKLNACGELDWLKIGDHPGYWDSLEAFEFTENGDLLLASDQAHGVIDENTGQGFPPGKLRLSRMSTEADTLWYDKFYPNGCGACTIEELKPSQSNGAFLSLDDYISYEGSPSYIRPVIVKYLENGDVAWTNVFGIEDGVLGHGPSLVELKSGNIMAVFARRRSGESFYFKPYYFKLNPEGEVLEHFILEIDTTLAYDGFNLALVNDSTAMLTLSPSTATASEILDYHFQLVKIDTAGQVLGSYVDTANFLPCSGLEVTENGDVLVALTEKIGPWDNFTDTDVLVKRINPQSMQLVEFPPNASNYYYLCPYPVESYNFNLKTRSLSINNGVAVQAWPNPTTTGFYIRWSATQNNQNLNFSLYNLKGQKIQSKTLKADNKEQWINTTNLSPGIYLWHLECKGKLLAKRKIVVY